jgi:hypothetical protein
MTNPTTNFGWVMPSPTDLVTDLPADFEVFGQAVDTDFVDLLGGTTGQILSKTSNTDLDFTWITNDVGDITAVNVTSPITGGGSSGAVTIGINAATTSVVGAVQLSDSTSTTSSVLASTPTATKAAYDLADGAIAKSTVTTAGDIIYRNATVPARLGIGTAGQILTVNSGATAPEWATAAAAIPANGTAFVAANENTSSTSYTNLTTAGPAATVTTGTRALVIISAEFQNGAAPGGAFYMGVDISGATTLSATDAKAATWFNSSGNNNKQTIVQAFIYTGLTAGSNTFTAKYKAAASVFYCQNRYISVVNMGS